jgi:hypothetical protein
LVVCGAYSVQDAAIAVVIAGLGILLGWSAAGWANYKGRYISFFGGLFVPFAVLYGIWPFDPTWRQDCGATPDPNILPIFAALVFPLLQLFSYFASKRWKQNRG